MDSVRSTMVYAQESEVIIFRISYPLYSSGTRYHLVFLNPVAFYHQIYMRASACSDRNFDSCKS
jgi:hypothetical protein